MKYICPEKPSCKIFSYSLIVCLLSSYLLLQRFNKVIQKLTRGWGNQALAYASVGFYEIMGLFIIMHYWTIVNLIRGTSHGCGNSWNGWTSFVSEFWGSIWVLFSLCEYFSSSSEYFWDSVCISPVGIATACQGAVGEVQDKKKHQNIKYKKNASDRAWGGTAAGMPGSS